MSNPSGAKVFLNGEHVGRTPYTMTDTKIIFSQTAVRLERPGYEPFTTTITRNEELDVGPLCGGLLVGIPLLWVLKYKPEHVYTLQRKGGGGGDDPIPSTAPDSM